MSSKDEILEVEVSMQDGTEIRIKTDSVEVSDMGLLVLRQAETTDESFYYFNLDKVNFFTTNTIKKGSVTTLKVV